MYQQIVTYNQKAFLLPDGPESMAAYHAIIRPNGQYRFRIHDCLTSIRLHGDLNDPTQVGEAVTKLRTLAAAAVEFADFIETEYSAAPSMKPEPQSRPWPARADMIAMIGEYAQACGFTFEEITSESRTREVCAVRQLIYMRLRGMKYSSTRIGKEFNRSHSTVLTSITKGERLLAVNDPLLTEYIKMFDEFNNNRNGL